jgi:hypothetical protein
MNRWAIFDRPLRGLCSGSFHTRSLSGVHLFPAGFQPTATLIEAGLHSDDSELSIFDFALRRHHPDKINPVTGN